MAVYGYPKITNPCLSINFIQKIQGAILSKVHITKSIHVYRYKRISAMINLVQFYHSINAIVAFLLIPVWIYSTISIFIISLSGLLGVAVIPVMKKDYYHHVLQFLVALAVGTLTGDALIHLLPHASFFFNFQHMSYIHLKYRKIF